MRRLTCGWFGAALLLFLMSCSGGRSERLKCESNSECEPDVCLRGSCVDLASAQVSARVRAVGADAPVYVIDNVGRVCEASSCPELPYGAQVTFRAEPVAGYRFVGWSGSPECVGSDAELVIASLTADTACDANYVRRQRVSGALPDGDTRGISASSSGTAALCLENACEVDSGSEVTLRAEERWGERFLGWSGAGCPTSGTPTLTVKAGDGDTSCVATFVKRLVIGGRAMNVEAGIEVSATEGSPVCEPGSCVVDQGASVTLTAPLVRGFRFGGWSGSPVCSGTNSPLALSKVQDSELCVATYLPRVTVRGKAEGPPMPPPVLAESDDLYKQCERNACEVDKGGAVTLLATSAPGYRLQSWAGPQCDGATSAAVTLREVQSDLECTASYALGVAVIGSVVGAPGEVVASSSTPGAECVRGGCRIDAGGAVSLVAPEVAGYRFAGWTGDAGCEGTALTLNFAQVLESRTCFARYATRFVVRGTSAPNEGGSVAASSSAADAQCNGSACTLDRGGQVTLTAAPTGSFRFTGWSGGGACTGASPTISVDDVQGNVTCQANFVGRVRVAASVGAGLGTVVARSQSGGASCAGAECAVDQGATVALIADPSVGQRFAGWSGCTESSEPTLTLRNVLVDTSCVANFEPLRFTVSSSVEPGGGGNVSARSPSAGASCQGGSCTVNFGSNVSLTAEPQSGFRFLNWGGACAGSNPTTTLSNVRADASCRANFTRVLVTIDAVATPAAGGSVSARSSAQGANCSGAMCSLPWGSSVTVTAQPAGGYGFVRWSGCGNSNDASFTIASVTESATCEATFDRLRYSVSGSVTPAGAGTVSASSSSPNAECSGGTCSLDHGGSVRLTANANPGYRFASWSCPGAQGTSVNVNNISGSVSCQATFVALTYAVRGVAGEGGSVSALPGSGVTCAGTTCTVTHGGTTSFLAAPNGGAGFEFGGWSGAGCSAAANNPLRVNVNNVTGDVTCTASFTLRSYTVNATTMGIGGSVGMAMTSLGSCTGTSCRAAHGATVTFTAQAETNAGYRFTGWSDACAASGMNPVGSYGPALANATCVAAFALNTYRVTASAINGRISASTPSASCEPSGEGATCANVPHNSRVEFTATANPNFESPEWSGECMAVPGNPLRATATVTGNVSCNVRFSDVPTYRVNVEATGGTIVAATPAACAPVNGVASCSVVRGTDLTFTAQPSPNFETPTWSVGCTPTANPLVASIANIAANTTCTVHFSAVPTFEVRGEAAGGGALASSEATLGSCTDAHVCIVRRGGSATFRVPATDSATVRFSRWSGACANAGTARTATVDDISANATCTANFVTVSRFTATGAVSGGGSVDVDSTAANASCEADSCTVDAGSTVTMTARANENFAFVGWSGCTRSTASTVDVTVTSNLTCTATFEPVRARATVVVEAASPNDASVSASSGTCGPSSCTVDEGTRVTISARAGGNFRFVRWTGCSPDSPTSAQTSVLATGGTITCTASFDGPSEPEPEPPLETDGGVILFPDPIGRQ